jgi:hypothetical protein
MALQTRKPTGLPSWPIGLLAGKEKTGKSWACAQASASPLLNRTLWIGVGENDPDEYGVVPGANFEIVVHDGSYRGILGAVRDAVAEPRGERPNLIVLDSGTRLWNLITDNAQVAANRRAKGRKNANNDYTISMDLWNMAAQQWKDVMDVLRGHDGPVLITARLDEVAVMEGGQPTTDRTWKVQGHKSLPFDVDWVVEMRERGKFLLTGVRSAHMPLAGPTEVAGWTVDAMWSRLGIAQGSLMGARTHSDTVRESEDVAPAPAAAIGPSTTTSAAPAEPSAKENWALQIADASTVAELGKVFARAQESGELGLPFAPQHQQHVDALVQLFGLANPPANVKVGQMIGAVKTALESQPPAQDQPAPPEPEPEPDENELPDAAQGEPVEEGEKVTEWPTATPGGGAGA